VVDSRICSAIQQCEECTAEGLRGCDLGALVGGSCVGCWKVKKSGKRKI